MFLCWIVQHYLRKSHWKFKIYKIPWEKIKYENIFTATESRFPPNAPTQKDRLAADSHQTQTPPDPTIASFAFLATKSPPSELNFNFFSHRTNGALVQSSMTNIVCYIGADTSWRVNNNDSLSAGRHVQISVGFYPASSNVYQIKAPGAWRWTVTSI
jgi:hypothetical protein